MKKLLLSSLLALLLALTACNATQSGTSDTSSPADSQPAVSDLADADVESTDHDLPDDLPDFVRSFQFDQLELNDTAAEYGGDYLDYLVYLLSSDQTAQLSQLLDLPSWTLATDFPDVSYDFYAKYFDHDGNCLNVDPWDEETCLISCFPAQGDVVRYWAPLSVLERVHTFNEGLEPLGTVDYTALEYYDLFCADPGFITLENSPFSDDVLAAYAITRLAQQDTYDWENGNTTEAFDAITQKYFGLTIQNFENGMSTVLDSGNITATGWDYNGGVYMVLDSQAEDGDGVITATFRRYYVGEDVWLDGLLPQETLDHMKEYLLTGHDEDFDAYELVALTFEVRYDVDSQDSYPFYHSLNTQVQNGGAA